MWLSYLRVTILCSIEKNLGLVRKITWNWTFSFALQGSFFHGSGTSLIFSCSGSTTNMVNESIIQCVQ